MKATLTIQNLKCGGCAHTITSRLAELNNIENVIVENDIDAVSFDFLSETDFQLAKNLLSKLGYPVEGETNSMSKKAKSFVSCAVGRMKS